MKYFTVKELAAYYNKSRQAILLAIKKGILKAELKGNIYLIREENLPEYEKLRYTRTLTAIDGVPLFSIEKGLVSVKVAEESLGLRSCSLYYQIQRGSLPAEKKGGMYVIKMQDLKKFAEVNLMDRRKKSFRKKEKRK